MVVIFLTIPNANAEVVVMDVQPLLHVTSFYMSQLYNPRDATFPILLWQKERLMADPSNSKGDIAFQWIYTAT